MADSSKSYPPSIEIAKLYKRRSARGTEYLVGRLGLAKLVVLPTGETTDDGAEVFKVLMQQAPPKPVEDRGEFSRAVKIARENRGGRDVRSDWQKPIDAPARIDDVEIPF